MNLKNNKSMEFIVFLSILLLAALIFSFALFGITGIRIVFGIVLVSLPFYLMFNSFKFPEGEKFVFSVLMGLTIFPSLVYLLGLVISFRISIITVFITLIGISFALRKYSH